MTVYLLTCFVAAVKAVTTLFAPGGRIFPDAAPEGSKNPCIVYQFAGDESEDVLDTGAATHGTLAYQMRIYGESRISANRLREAFRLKCRGLEPVPIGGRWKIEGCEWGTLLKATKRK